MNDEMENPFPKSVSVTEKCKRLLEVVCQEDTLGILMDADPDAMASALALKRFFWRKVKKVKTYHVNTIKRADNLSFIQLLNLDQHHIRYLDSKEITKWALVDSQPHHNEQFKKYKFDIIIDHHPLGPLTTARFVDVKEEYGATATMLTEYLKAAKIRPSPRVATALFYGIKTDTDNFVRDSVPNDIIAFKYLYRYVNMNTVKKIESSEMTRKTVSRFKTAMENLTLLKDTAFIHMGKAEEADDLVIIADFFMRMAEITWSIVSGVYGRKLIVIIRNAGFRRDAGKTAQDMFGDWGSVGGHRNAARAEIPLKNINKTAREDSDIRKFVISRIKKGPGNGKL